VSPLPTASATFKALVLGLLIPVISSIVPIQNALNKQLAESLNNIRSKTKGQKVDIESPDGFSHKMPYLIFGSIGVLVGTSIFFFLPLSVISFNIGMMLNIFFMILIGMIFGLTLIAFNL
jgi:hypothetical protein